VLAVGASFPAVSVLVNVLESAPDAIVNTGITGGGGETNLTNNRDDDAVAITSSADVAIVKTVVPTTTPPGVNVTYTLVVTNNGPSTAKAVQVSDPLPAGMKFVSVTPSACGLAGKTVTCALGDLVKGQSVSITVVASIPLALAKTTKTNTATVSSSTPDSNLANNEDDATVTITAAPPSKLAIRKSASPTAVQLNGNDTPAVVFTIVLKVPSKIDAKQVDVCDTLPADMVFVSAPGATFSKGRACWHLRVAKAGSSRTFKITATVDKDFAGASLTNVVTATAANARKVTAKATVDVGHVQGVTSGPSVVTG
jgi:large repetitive protein